MLHSLLSDLLVAFTLVPVRSLLGVLAFDRHWGIELQLIASVGCAFYKGKWEVVLRNTAVGLLGLHRVQRRLEVGDRIIRSLLPARWNLNFPS